MEIAGQWWYTPLIPALGRQRQVNLYEFEANLVYKSEFQDRNQSYTKKPVSKKILEGGQGKNPRSENQKGHFL